MKPGFAFDAAGFAAMTGIALGKVVDVHPEHNSVDIRVFRDRRRLIGVPVIGLGNSGTTGVIDLPVPDLTTSRDEDAKWNSDNTDKRDIMAVVAFIDGAPVCMGFIYPPIGEMTFEGEEAKERRLYRHASDYYTTLDKAGNVEIAHPSGTWIAMSESPVKNRLTERDYDRMWQVKRNLERAVHGVISWWNGPEKKEKARLHVTPTGGLFAWLNEKLHLRIGRDHGKSATLDVQQSGSVALASADSITLAAGDGGSGGASFIGTPSFQPSETPAGEIYGFDGQPGPNAGAKAVIRINKDGSITIQGDVSIEGSLEVNGVPVP